MLIRDSAALERSAKDILEALERPEPARQPRFAPSRAARPHQACDPWPAPANTRSSRPFPSPQRSSDPRPEPQRRWSPPGNRYPGNPRRSPTGCWWDVERDEMTAKAAHPSITYPPGRHAPLTSSDPRPHVPPPRPPVSLKGFSCPSSLSNLRLKPRQ